MKKIGLLLFIFVIPVLALAEDSGICGDGVSYIYDSKTKTLNISYTGSGTGAMTDFVADEGVTNAPWYSYRTDVENVILGDNVSSIGNNSFYQCSNLSSVSISNSVVSIGRNSFRNCKKLKSVSLPSSIKEIRYAAFAYCSSLSSLVIPEGVESVSEYLLYQCKELESIVIPSTVTNIEQRAFYRCEKLTDVQLPKNLNSLGDYSFAYCKSLKTIILNDGLKSIGSGSFIGCSISSISIPASVSYIGLVAFDGSGIVEVYISDLEAWCKIKFAGYRSNPLNADASLILNGVRQRELVIPESITDINNYAFAGCSSISKIVFHDKVKSIGEHAFYGCLGMSSIQIPASIDSLGVGAFSRCLNLWSIKVDQNNKKYDSRNDCNAIMKTESNELVAGCQKTVIPDNTKSIGDYAFYNLFGIKAVKLPASLEKIGTCAFYSCYDLTSVLLPEGMTSIGAAAFSGCNNLKDIVLPNSVTFIGHSAFDGCSSLSDIVFPNSIDSIKNSTFSGCGFKTVIIPNSVKCLDNFAFSSCRNLTSISISENVDSIGDKVFDDCINLEDVYCYTKEIPATHMDAFFNSTSKATLYVPEQLLDVYKTTSPWSSFYSILPMSQSGINGKLNRIDTITDYYTIDGMRRKNSAKGIIIRKVNDKYVKVMIR